MASKYADIVEETTTTTGTGTLNLAGAGDRRRTFVAGFGSGNKCFYKIEHESADEWEIGIGTVTSGSPDTLARTTVIDSSNSGSAVSFSSGTKYVFCDTESQQLANLERPFPPGGRLSLTSYTSVPTSDVTAATTLYYTWHRHSWVSLYVNSRWRPYSFGTGELSIAVPSQVFRIYDVYLYDNSGTLTLELVAWDSGGQTTFSVSDATNATPIVVTTTASHGLSTGDLVGINGCVGNTAPNGKVWSITVTAADKFSLDGSVGNGTWTSGGTVYVIPTARTTGIGWIDGVWVQGADPTRLLLGSFMTTGTSGQTEDSAASRLLWNLYHQAPRRVFCYDSTNSWSYTTSSWRAANLSTTLGTGRVAALFGMAGWCSLINKTLLASSSSVDVAGSIGFNSVSTNGGQYFGVRLNSAAYSRDTGTSGFEGMLSAGYQYMQRIELGGSGTTFYGDDGGSTVQSAMTGHVVL